jgi:hypothetical protein
VLCGRGFWLISHENDRRENVARWIAVQISPSRRYSLFSSAA